MMLMIMMKEKLKRLKKEEEIRQTKLKESMNKLKEQLSDEIQQIEEWCYLESKGIIFDSDFYDWTIGTSIFDKIVNQSLLI